MYKMKKRIIFFIVGFLVLIIIVILLVLALTKSNNKNKEMTGKLVLSDKKAKLKIVDVSNETLSSEHCSENVCISNLKIECASYHGTVSYEIVLKGEKKNKYALIDLKAYIKIDDLEKDIPKNKVYRYRDYDLTNVSDYTFSVLDDSYSKMFAN